MQQYKTELIYPGNVAVEDPASGAILDPLVRYEMQYYLSKTCLLLALIAHPIDYSCAC